jgi:hypothetical protein
MRLIVRTAVVGALAAAAHLGAPAKEAEARVDCQFQVQECPNYVFLYCQAYMCNSNPATCTSGGTGSPVYFIVRCGSGIE